MNNIKTFEGFWDYLKNTKPVKNFIEDRRISKLKREISNRCYGLRISNFTVNNDGSVNVMGDLRISDTFYDRDLKPLHFKEIDGNVTIGTLYREMSVTIDKITGSWDCYSSRINNLKGTPKEVGGNFNCRRNNLQSLEGGPEYVGGNFDVSNNRISSLKGAPKYVGGNFDISENRLVSLEGSPKYIGGRFDISENKITSFDNVPDCNLRFDNNPIYYIWSLVRYRVYGSQMSNYIDLFKAYDPIHPTGYGDNWYGKNSIIHLSRLKLFLEEVLKTRIEDIVEFLKRNDVSYYKELDRRDRQSQRSSVYSVIQEFYYIR